MAIDPRDVRSVLNDLIQTCKDSQQAFVDAAHHMGAADLKTQFLEISQQRSKFAGELQQEVTLLQGNPETGGSAMGALQRGWAGLKASIAGQHDTAVIREMESLEDHTVKQYQEAAGRDLPGDVRETVERQLNQILESYRQIRTLQVRTSGGAA